MANNSTINHLHAENKRLNELVVHIVSECNDRVNYARSNELLDLQHQLNALRSECFQLRHENESLRLNSSVNTSNIRENNELQLEKESKEKEERREMLLNKLQGMHSVLDGLSTHGSQLHKMVSALYHKNNNANTNIPQTNVATNLSPPTTSNSPPLTHQSLLNSSISSNSFILNASDDAPANIFFPPKPNEIINPLNITKLNDGTNKVAEVAKERDTKSTEDNIKLQNNVELASWTELLQLESLLSRFIPDIKVAVLEARYL